jgi:hypothetical protein
METYGGVDVQIRVFLTSALVRVGFTPLPIHLGGRTPYPLYRSLGRPQSQSGRYEKVKILDYRDWNPNLSVVQPVVSRYERDILSLKYIYI